MEWLQEWDWGSVPDWFAAIGTVGTLGIVVIAWKRDHDASRDQRAFQRSEQARQIRVGSVERPMATRSGEDGIDVHWRVVVENLSPYPIHDVEVGLESLPAALSDPGRTPRRPSARKVLPSGERVEHATVLTVVGCPLEEIECVPTVRFTDSARQRWEYGPDYVLKPLTT